MATSAVPTAIPAETSPSASSRRSLTPAEAKIELAQRSIQAKPDSVESHNALALALTARARETGDPSHYDEALQALAKSFRIAPGNFAAQRIQAWALLGRHRFSEALEVATALQKRFPDDLMVYGLVGDAQVELGNYVEAEEAVQWMLDLRPGNVPGLTRAAYLRELFGDTEGAIDLFAMAYQQIPGPETEDRAWILTQLAHLRAQTGQWSQAEQLSEQALELFPDYHYALAQMVRVRTVQGRHEEALALAMKLREEVPHPENLLRVAQILHHLDRDREAAVWYRRFEQAAEAESGSADNCNRDLIFHYAGQGENPAAALKVARREVAVRHDVHTLHAHAWALHASGLDEQAYAQMARALAVGLRDVELFHHAGVIASASGKSDEAEKFYREAVRLDPISESGVAAQAALGDDRSPIRAASP